MDGMWHAFHLDVVSFVVNQIFIDVLNIYLHLKDFWLEYVLKFPLMFLNLQRILHV